jgi:thiol-disulfide isomerase/thioredoxin
MKSNKKNQDENLFKDSNVKSLTNGDFDDKEPWIFKNKKCSIVLFYANWCGHCQNFKPLYIDFADSVSFIQLYAMDTDKQQNFLDKLSKFGKKCPLKIKGYPSIWFYKNGIPIKEFNGERNFGNLLKEAMSVCDCKCECHKL